MTKFESSIWENIYDNILFLMQAEIVYAGFDDSDAVTAEKC